MRVQKNGISVHAIAGNRTVLFGMDADETVRRGLLGFALGRKSASGVRWMRGFKFFESTASDPLPGERRSTVEHPIQSFQWGDYSVDPGSTRDFVVKAVYGAPTALTFGPDIEISATTFNAPSDTHQVFFNRGAIPSQAFADRFGNIGPTADEIADPGNAKTQWLSRGLLEAALAYIAQAVGPAFELRVAAYEFYYKPILNALKEAAKRGAVVRVSFDGGDQRRDGTIKASSISTENLAKIAECGLDAEPSLSLHPRTMFSKIPHNKFIVLLKNGIPEQVWTGSTNFTPSGFLGQSNVGHVVREHAAAAAYNTYWEEIAKDPATRGFKDFNTASFPGPIGDLASDTLTPVFSPRRRGMLEWYADMLGQATKSVMFTAAFGVALPLAEKLAIDRDFLRFLLIERRDRRPEVMEMLERDRDTRIALGSGLNTWAIRMKLDGHALDEWFKAEEHFRTQGHIFYIHTKYMLLDALTDDPKLFTGSANFSAPSAEGNDENMILMRGPGYGRVAQVYATEFMRLFNHLYFRTIVLRRARAGQGAQTGVAVLDPTGGWVARHFRNGSYHDRKRKLFR